MPNLLVLYQKSPTQQCWKINVRYQVLRFYKSVRKISFTKKTDFIETKQVYNKYQCGYHKNHSTATMLSKLYDDINLAMNRSELTMAVFTDSFKIRNFRESNFRKLR